MNISIFGLGYVGCVSLGCLAKNGNKVIGVDVNQTKVDLVNKGKATIIEKNIDAIIESQYKLGNIYATNDYKKAVLNSDVSIICVGTPTTKSGHLDLGYIFKTAKQIGISLKEKASFYSIAIRSTVLPGTNKIFGEIVEQYSGKLRNIDFAIVSNPEFLREGSAVEDYYNPPITVLGSDNTYALNVFKEIYSKVNGKIECVDIEVAEIIKYVNNTYHALKICFANEVGNICKKINIDSHQLMKLFCMDKQLNISDYYFKPGFAYGGSCLPKDMKALKTIAHDNYISSPVIENIHESNENQKRIAIDLIEKTGRKNIGFLGLSFKQGTDDLRYSPTVEVVEYFYGKGYNIYIWDKNVHVAKLIGTNKEYINNRIPHLLSLITDDMNSVINISDCIIVTQKINNFEKIIIANKKKIFIDVVRTIDMKTNGNYIGISW